MLAAPCTALMAAVGEESDRDVYGFWEKSPNFVRMKNLNVHVVDMPDFETYFAYYFPPGFEAQPVKRAVVAVHGTDGTPYAEIQDEQKMADRLGYAVIAIQMRVPNGKSGLMPPRKLYGLIDQSVNYLRQTYGFDLTRLAYVGFSVGGAKSFQIAYYDRLSPRPLFSLIVNHSGLSKPETSFLRESQQRGLAKPFAGLPFALYCGMEDEEWGNQQCSDMEDWKNRLAELGAPQIFAIHDDEGGHGGYRKNPAHHEKVMRWFVELTP